MVKAKSVSKSKTKAKGEASVSSHKKGHGSKKWDLAVPMCCECGEFVTDDTKALQCEGCVEAEVWKCAGCLGLSDELYDQLASSCKNSLHWFCEKCEDTLFDSSAKTEKIVTMIGDLQSKADGLEMQLLSNVAELERKLSEKIQAVEAAVQRNADGELLKSVEERLKKLEGKPVGFEQLQQRLEHRLDQIGSVRDIPDHAKLEQKVDSVLDQLQKTEKDVRISEVQECVEKSINCQEPGRQR